MLANKARRRGGIGATLLASTADRGATVIAATANSVTAAPGFSLLFAAGGRPTAAMVETWLAGPGLAAAISHRPAAEEGRLEILASGLTFDLSGLAPAPAEPSPAGRQAFALPCEAVRLALGGNLAAGEAMLPVVRIMTALALRLAELPGLRGVCWHPAASWIEPADFARAGREWLAGGAFPFSAP